jgi:hypothetical protein
MNIGWLKSQRIPQLLEVNLGSWSGLTVRKMAEEAECLDFYNHDTNRLVQLYIRTGHTSVTKIQLNAKTLRTDTTELP